MMMLVATGGLEPV